jgi:hypothetical protein
MRGLRGKGTVTTMYLEITNTGRVFLRRDLSKYKHIHAPGKEMKIIYDKHPSQREQEDAKRFAGIVTTVLSKEGVAA